MLPIHPQPRADESLSSWMARLAFGNGFPLKAFFQGVLLYPHLIWRSDIDADLHPGLLDRLSLVTDQVPDSLQRMTLQHWGEAAFRREIVFGRTPWILPIGRFHRGKSNVGMQFCPLCLAGDEVPYFRIYWRMLLLAVCPVHHCPLEDRCSCCGEPVVYHQYGRRNFSAFSALADIVRCHRCGFDLRVSPAINWPVDEPELILSIINMANFLSDGVRRYRNKEHHDHVAAIRIWYRLINILTGRNGKQIVAVLNERVGLKCPDETLRTTIKVATSPSRIRFKIFVGVAWLMAEWPSRLFAISEPTNSGQKPYRHKNDAISAWFGDLIGSQ